MTLQEITQIVGGIGVIASLICVAIQIRNNARAVKLLRKLMTKPGFAQRRRVTDKLPSSGAARAEIGMTAQHENGLGKNNRAENAHQPVRRLERKMQRFKSTGSARRFLSSHAVVYNSFNVQRHLISRRILRCFRASAMEQWRSESAA